MTIFPNDYPGGQYVVCPVNATTTCKVGATGNAGDYLEGVTINFTTTTPTAVTIADNATTVVATPAGTATVLPLVVYIPIRAYSVNGPWKVTIGATGATAVATGRFS